MWSKNCRSCKNTLIYWDNEHRMFVNEDGQRHLCPLDPGKSKQDIEKVTLESVYEDIVKRFDDLVGRETSTQTAIAAIRKQISELSMLDRMDHE